MKSENTNHAAASNNDAWQQNLWLWSMLTYAVAEGVFWIFDYSSIYHNCIPCLKPVAYYIFQWLLNIIFTGALWYALNYFYRKSTWPFIIINISLFIAYYFLWIFIKYGLYAFGPALVVDNAKGTYTLKDTVHDSWLDIGKYVLRAAAFYVVKFYAAYNYTSRQRIKLTILNKEMQLKLMKQQLSPHFYFNTINNLYGLARSNSTKLSPALQQLQNIMEYVLIECNGNKVSLQKEIDFLKSYIALERLRYEETADIKVAFEGDANGHTILPLFLIQLVENAFKHGMKEKSDQNWMQVKVGIKENILFFTVNNSCYSQAFTEGVGLTSVKHRLNLQYEDKYEMNIINSDEKFTVFLRLNLL